MNNFFTLPPTEKRKQFELRALALRDFAGVRADEALDPFALAEFARLLVVDFDRRHAAHDGEGVVEQRLVGRDHGRLRTREQHVHREPDREVEDHADHRCGERDLDEPAGYDPAFVAADVNLPTPGAGIDPSTLYRKLSRFGVEA